MVTSQGRVKIADFGIAKATSAAQTANLTTTGTTLGTPRYMAPERALGQDVGPWSDLYAVGVIAFELLVGRTPFHETEEPMAMLLRQINEPVPPVISLVPDVGEDLSDWVERLLVKAPERRTRSAAAAWDELEEILIGAPRRALAARRGPPGTRAGRSPRATPVAARGTRPRSRARRERRAARRRRAAPVAPRCRRDATHGAAARPTRHAPHARRAAAARRGAARARRGLPPAAPLAVPALVGWRGGGGGASRRRPRARPLLRSRPRRVAAVSGPARADLASASSRAEREQAATALAEDYDRAARSLEAGRLRTAARGAPPTRTGAPRRRSVARTAATTTTRSPTLGRRAGDRARPARRGRLAVRRPERRRARRERALAGGGCAVWASKAESAHPLDVARGRAPPARA